MTPTVPDPFRDQLAEALAIRLARGVGAAGPVLCGEIADALLPLIAAEVEARVQAAANQRAAEELRAAARDIRAHPDYVQRGRVADWLTDRAAALAQHADGGGQQ